MNNKLRKALIIQTNETIEVYKLKNGMWCNYLDCKTTYFENELNFIN